MYATTLSYALGRSAVVAPYVPPESIADRWLDIRRLTGQRERNQPVEDILNAASVLGMIGSKKRRKPRSGMTGLDWVLQVTSALASGGPVEALEVANIDDDWYSDGMASMSGARDARVGAFERAINQLRSKGRAGPWDDFVLGFLGSQIGPGSLAHAPLVAQAYDICPSVLLWYAICASLGDQRQFIAEQAGVSRRISTGLERSVRPTYATKLRFSFARAGYLSRHTGSEPNVFNHVLNIGFN